MDLPIRGQSLADQVYGRLCAALLSGAFAPGERVNIRSVATQMDVSVTPAREAIMRLVSEGALLSSDRNAIVVPELTLAEVGEIFEVRRMIEGNLAHAAAELLTADECRRLASLQTRYLAALGAKDFREALRLNSLFHFLIYGKPDQPIKLKIVEGLWQRIGPTLHYMYPALLVNRGQYRNHEAIVEQAERRSAAGLGEAVLADLASSEAAIRAALATSSGPTRARP